MALSIRRGASKVFQLTLENCTPQDYLWEDFGTIRVRLSQGGLFVDKIATIDKNDATACLVYYSQEDTIRFSSDSKAKIQVFVLKESTHHQLAIKSTVFDVLVEESLWNNVITNGSYTGIEEISMDNPEYPDPIGHDFYGYMHMDIKEYSGIITETEGAVLEGNTLIYDPSSETISSETE